MRLLFKAIRVGGLTLFSAVVIVGFAVVAACGGDDDDSAATPTADAAVGKIEVRGAWVRASTNDVAAGYFQVENGGLDDRLVSVTANVGTAAQLHETVTEGASSKMQEVTGGVDVPANGELKLAPGGYHLMIMGLKEPLSEGGFVDLVLQFQNAGKIDLKVPVLTSAPE